MSGFKELYRVVQLPVFQNRMYETSEEAINCPKGDVILVQNMNTGLIYNQNFVPELMVYDAGYQNEQALSTVFRKHLDKVSAIIRKYFSNKTLIEVGCGKGFFLEHLQLLGFEIKGVDPTYEGTNASVIKKYFTPSLGLQSEGIILRHVLEHVQNPLDFLGNILAANGGRGKVYIEVPCFDWICEHRAWFDIYYEHVNYFRLSDFNRMFTKVYEAGHLFDGQYLYVIADLASLQSKINYNSDGFKFPGDFLNKVEFFAEKIKAKSKDHRTINGNIVIWGGASKGVIFALFMDRAGAKIDYVIDINPAKQGKYIGGSGLKVFSPEEVIDKIKPGSDLFIMNRNYLTEIRQATNSKFNYLTVDY